VTASVPKHGYVRSSALQNGRKLLLGLIAWNQWVSNACSDEHRELTEISDQIWPEWNLRSKEHGGRQVVRVKQDQTGRNIGSV
jgi:hypothetical protein